MDHLQAPDVTALYPFEGQLHEFQAGPNGAAVLDVLLPPYDESHDRDCTFYHIRPDNESSTTVILSMGAHAGLYPLGSRKTFIVFRDDTMNWEVISLIVMMTLL